jgi:hypothetical protein
MTRRRLGRLGYVLATLLVLFPLMDLAANIWPWKLAQVGWRYGSYGILSGYFMTPLMGLMLAMGVALALEQRRVARAVGVAAWLVALLFFATTIVYVLDALQVRATVPAQARAQFGIGTFKAMAKNVISASVLVWVGWIGFRAMRQTGGHHTKDTTPPLVSSDN